MCRMDGGADVAGLALRVVRARLGRGRYGLRVLRVGMILLGGAASLQSLSWPVFPVLLLAGRPAVARFAAAALLG